MKTFYCFQVWILNVNESCLCFCQTLLPNALYSVLFLADKDGSTKLDRDLNVQVKMSNNSHWISQLFARFQIHAFCSSNILSQDLMAEIGYKEDLPFRAVKAVVVLRRDEENVFIRTLVFAHSFLLFLLGTDWDTFIPEGPGKAHRPDPADTRPGRHLPLQPWALDQLQTGWINKTVCIIIAPHFDFWMDIYNWLRFGVTQFKWATT